MGAIRPSAVHGFVALEADHGFAFPSDVERSFDRLVHALVLALSSWSILSGPGREVPTR
jgi:Tetracyclin repressor-like, C-terminal domain